MIPFQSFMNDSTFTSLMDLLDESLKEYDGTPFAKQMALQRSWLDDMSVPQIE